MMTNFNNWKLALGLVIGAMSIIMQFHGLFMKSQTVADRIDRESERVRGLVMAVAALVLLLK